MLQSVAVSYASLELDNQVQRSTLCYDRWLRIALAFIRLQIGSAAPAGTESKILHRTAAYVLSSPGMNKEHCICPACEQPYNTLFVHHALLHMPSKAALESAVASLLAAQDSPAVFLEEEGSGCISWDDFMGGAERATAAADVWRNLKKLPASKRLLTCLQLALLWA